MLLGSAIKKVPFSGCNKIAIFLQCFCNFFVSLWDSLSPCDEAQTSNLVDPSPIQIR